jgi:hypothetical protein
MPLTLAANCCVALRFSVACGGVTLTATVTVTLADPDLVESACDTAVTVTVAGFGTFAGAVYTPLGEIDPVVAPFPPVVPFTCHVTAKFVVFVTVAEKTTEPLTATFCDTGETATVTGGGCEPPPQFGKSSTDTIATVSRKFRLRILTSAQCFTDAGTLAI